MERVDDVCRRRYREPERCELSRELVDAWRCSLPHNGSIGTGQPWTVVGACGTAPAPSPSPTSSPSPTGGADGCLAAWSATAVYVGGQSASRNGVNYRANWWTQGDDPATRSGGAGTGRRGPRSMAAGIRHAHADPDVDPHSQPDPDSDPDVQPVREPDAEPQPDERHGCGIRLRLQPL